MQAKDEWLGLRWRWWAQRQMDWKTETVEVNEYLRDYKEAARMCRS